MPNTRKKIIKTVYKDEDSDVETGDFSDSGSEAHISEQSSSEEIESTHSSGEDFVSKTRKKSVKPRATRKAKFAKTFISKINKQINDGHENEDDDAPALVSVKDLTEEDKLLPSILNLSESDSSEDESTNVPPKKSTPAPTSTIQSLQHASEDEDNMEYKDVWSNNLYNDSEAVAKKAFIELERHKNKIEETKASIKNYMSTRDEKESNVTDLLAQGEEMIPQKITTKKKIKSKKTKYDSDSDAEDWEEVKESKTIPQQGLQLFVEFPDAISRKKKVVDIEMMMKRKMNRVKKEHQVYLHKVHVLCWLGHGNYVSRILNDQDLLAVALSLVPSKECYPGERVDMKYIEQISKWFKDKLTLKQDKNENKFKPKAPHLKELLMSQIKHRIVTARKYVVFIFVAMLRALGLQCRVMFNFVTLPLKPPTSLLCSLSTKPKDNNSKTSQDKSSQSSEKTENKEDQKKKTACVKQKGNKGKLAQVDGNDDSCSDFENIMQVDGNDDAVTNKTQSTSSTKATDTICNTLANNDDEGVSPPKRSKKVPNKTVKVTQEIRDGGKVQRKNLVKNKSENYVKKVDTETQPNAKAISPKLSLNRTRKKLNDCHLETEKDKIEKASTKIVSPRKTRSTNKKIASNSRELPQNDLIKNNKGSNSEKENKSDIPRIQINTENKSVISSKYFDDDKPNMEDTNDVKLSRKRSHTAGSTKIKKVNEIMDKQKVTKTRTKSAPGNDVQNSKYFSDGTEDESKKPKIASRQNKKGKFPEDNLRVSHRDLPKIKTKPKNDITEDLVGIMKSRIKDAKLQSKKGIDKGKVTKETNNDSDFLSEEDPKPGSSDSDDDFKPIKISPRPSTSRRIDRRVISTDDEVDRKNKIDVWCEVYVEELEQWICVDIIKGKIHDTKNIYSQANHPVCYVIGWDNNNYLKDLTRRYVPHWNTVTRKQRAEPAWWSKAIQPWLGPNTARDKEENEYLDRMQLEAPLPKSIAEYKNHPLYALKRHLLKFEAIYPPDASTLGFIRGEAVFSRDCVVTCRSRDTWLKEAKVVKLGQIPYKVVKARPKWDKLSNKLITDKPLEVFGPWQVQDYEPPVAENGIVPRNAYGNVELFKECMLPIGTAHIKLPGLNKVARKLNIDCAPAMTGFDFNGGWSHPVYDGFVVCKEYEEIITEAWVKDQEEQVRRERERTETRVYGNWKKLIRGLLIRERIKDKYGFDEPSTSQHGKVKKKAPRLVVKKKT